MGDFFEYFWNWIKSNNPNNRIAPPAEKRYANSTKGKRRYAGNEADYVKQSSNAGIMGSAHPAEILRYLDERGDTVYVETPDDNPSAGRHPYISIRKPRRASSRNKFDNEYDILKRRFNTAYNLAR